MTFGIITYRDSNLLPQDLRLQPLNLCNPSKCFSWQMTLLSQPGSQPAVLLSPTVCTTFTKHIASVTQSCSFTLYNIKFRSFPTEYATQLLGQAPIILCFDYCNTLLAQMLACTVQPAKNCSCHCRLHSFPLTSCCCSQ